MEEKYNKHILEQKEYERKIVELYKLGYSSDELFETIMSKNKNQKEFIKNCKHTLDDIEKISGYCIYCKSSYSRVYFDDCNAR